MPTVIPFGDPKAVKKWAGGLALESQKNSYWNRFEGTSDNSIIQRKTDVESDAGDRVSFDLSAKLRGRPVSGDKRLEGNEEALKFYTDEVIIDQLRKSVSAGGKMTRKRTVHDLRKTAKDRLVDYWAQYLDELKFIYMSGARGMNQDFIEPTEYTGHAGNPLRAPDAQHLMFGGAATSKATLAAADGMTRAIVERAATKAAMLAATDPKASNLMPVKIGGEDHLVLLMSKWQAHNLRTSDTTGWLDIQKAAAAAEGRKNPIFQGGLGMINNIVLHSHESVIRFADYGAANNVTAARALLMGRQAGVIAYGTAGGLRFTWKEEMKDFDNEPTVAAGVILGVSKTRFNNRDFGLVSIDTADIDPNK